MIRFWSKVEIADPHSCWEWRAAKITEGYGRFWLRGSMQPAYRVAYELTIGEIPPGLELDHLCLNPGCVNPYHLEPVTHRENMRRSSAKGGVLYIPKKECVNGHLRTPANLYKSGHCKACKGY